MYKSYKDASGSHGSVSKAINYVVSGAAAFLFLVILLPLWSVAIMEVFIPAGMHILHFFYLNRILHLRKTI